MNKFMLSGLAAFLCFGVVHVDGMKKTGTFSALPKVKIQAPKSNLKRAQTFSTQSDFTALISRIKSFDDYVLTLSQYLRHVGHFGAKLPVSKEKLDKDVSDKVRPLIQYIDALRQNKKSKVSLDLVHSKIQSGNQGVFATDEFAAAALIMAKHLLEKKMNTLPAASQPNAKQLLQRLEWFFDILNRNYPDFSKFSKLVR